VLERAVLDQFGVQAAVGGIVDVLEKPPCIVGEIAGPGRATLIVSRAVATAGPMTLELLPSPFPLDRPRPAAMPSPKNQANAETQWQMGKGDIFIIRFPVAGEVVVLGTIRGQPSRSQSYRSYLQHRPAFAGAVVLPSGN
jgi:hypothetical protein